MPHEHLELLVCHGHGVTVAVHYWPSSGHLYCLVSRQHDMASSLEQQLSSRLTAAAAAAAALTGRHTGALCLIDIGLHLSFTIHPFVRGLVCSLEIGLGLSAFYSQFQYASKA